MKRIVLVLGMSVPALAAAAPHAEVCPQLRSETPIIPLWDEEGLWPACPVASPIVSAGGRSATRLQPCAATVEHDGKALEEMTYRYAKGGLVSAVQVSHFGPKPLEQTYTCKRDGHGQLTSCTSGDGPPHAFAYQHGVLVRSGERAFKRDKRGRLANEVWDDGTTIDYAYNTDGTLASVVSHSERSTVTTTFAYDHGHVAAVHTEPSDKSFGATDIAYTYDGAGRVTREIQKRGAHGAPPAGTTRIEPPPAETVSYTYDAKGRLTQETRDLGSGGSYVTTYRYDCR